jgi:hypothetical protein
MRRRLSAVLLWVLLLTGSMTDLNRVTALLNTILAAAAAPTWPPTSNGLALKLMGANGSGTANGTELSSEANFTGYTVGGATMAPWTAISGTTASITGPVAAVSWTNSSGATAWSPVAGVEVWDKSGTPLRWFFGALNGGSVTINAGNTLQFAIGSIGFNASTW